MKKSDENLKLLKEKLQEGLYIEKVENALKNIEGNNNLFEIITITIRNLNKEYNKDGSYPFNKLVEKVKAKKYPKDIEEKLIKEFQHAFLVEFYEKDKEEEKKEIQNQNNEYQRKIKLIKKYVDEDVFRNTYSDWDDDGLDMINAQITSAPIKIQKLFVDLADFRYFKNPSEEIIIYALETKNISLNWLKPEQRSKKIDLIAAQAGQIYKIKETKNLSKEAKLAFIENNPDKIITEITTENFNTKDLTIYDLNKKELEAYKKGLEGQKKKQEQEQMKLVEKDPRKIYEIKNPSDLVKNYAINTFIRQWGK